MSSSVCCRLTPSVGSRWRSYQISRHQQAELPEPDAALRLEHLADLLPRRVHELFLLVLDRRACRSRRPRGSADRGSAGAPSCRRCRSACRRASSSTRLVSACHVPYSGGVMIGSGSPARSGRSSGRLIRSREVDLRAAAGRGRPRSRTCPAAREGTVSGGLQRAAELQDAAELRLVDAAARSEPGSCTSISRKPTRGSTGFGSSSRTSVSKSPLVAGAEEPAVVVRESSGPRAASPGSHADIVAATSAEVEAEPGAAPGFERRHQERVVGRVLRRACAGRRSREYARSGILR